jgi:hypothetical protein
MSQVSPTLEGFRAAFRRPTLTFAEIAWRWTLGATAWALLLFSFFEYLNTLPVTHADAALLSTRHPALVGRALTHILRGSLNRVVLAALLGALALSLLWIVTASIGRAATVRALLDYFAGRRNVADDSSAETSEKVESLSFRWLVGLHFLPRCWPHSSPSWERQFLLVSRRPTQTLNLAWLSFSSCRSPV